MNDGWNTTVNKEAHRNSVLEKRPYPVIYWGFRRDFTPRAKVKEAKLKLNEKRLQQFSFCVLKQQVFGVFSTKKSKIASLELITTMSAMLVCLPTSNVLLCGIQARDQVLHRASTSRWYYAQSSSCFVIGPWSPAVTLWQTFVYPFRNSGGQHLRLVTKLL